MFQHTDQLPDILLSKPIVIVDDSFSMRSLLMAALKEAGFKKVIGCADGIEALEYIGQHPVDLIICDWGLPRLSGIELLHTIRSNKWLEPMPFLMLTTTDTVEQVKLCIKYRVTDYLLKPLKPHMLVNKAMRALIRTDFKPVIVQRKDIDVQYLAAEEKDQGVA